MSTNGTTWHAQWEHMRDCYVRERKEKDAALAALAELKTVAEGLRNALGERDLSSLDDDDWAAIDALAARKEKNP